MSKKKIIGFNPAGHEYKINDIWVPSVNQCLAAAGFDYWRSARKEDLEKNRTFGKNFHKARELYDAGTLDFKTLNKVFYPYLNQWARAKKELGIKVKESEMIVYSKKYMVAGTMDILGKYKDDLTVIDTKTVFEVYPSTNLQLAGYQGLYNEMNPGNKIKRRLIINIYKDYYEPAECNDLTDWLTFLSAVHITWFKVKHKIYKREEQ